MRAAAMVDDASGMVVTNDTNSMPSVLEAMPVMPAMPDRKRREDSPPQEDRLDLYQALIDNAPFDISFKDLNGTYLLTNRAFDTNLQKSKDAIIGKTLTQLIGPEKAAPILALDRQALEARTGVSAEVPSLVVDSLQNYWSTKFPIENDQGEVVGVGSILADISKTKRLEERAVWAHQQLVDALEALTDGLAIFDADERLVVCNSRYKDLQSPVNDIMVPGAKFEDLLRDTVDRNQLAAAVDRGEAWVQERLCSFRNPGEPIELEFHDGTWMRLYERKTAEGGTVGVRIDITELKRRERQLRESEQILRVL